MIQNYINHIALVVDKSGSMSALSRKVVEVFDSEISYLRKRSIELNQETRISVYLFNSSVECLVFDMDVMRMSSLSGYYQTDGMTALIDGTLKAIDDMQRLPEIYGDHAFLVYVMTDGEENSSRWPPRSLVEKIASLPENWTTVCLVPDAKGIHEAKKFGFSPQNIQIWSTTESGVEQVGREFRSSIDSYMTARSQGVRGTKSFFKIDLNGVNSTKIKNTLSELSPKNYKVFVVDEFSPIREFVEKVTGRVYVKGNSYYELVKSESVQGYKDICIQNIQNGKVYSGKNARTLLGLPATEARVAPGAFGEWRIFVQSTSVNRNLLKGNCVLVLL